MIYLNSDSLSNIPEPASEVAAQVAGQQARSAREMTLGDIFSRAFEIYRQNPVLIVPSLIPVTVLILGFVLFAGFIGLAAIFGGDELLAVSAVGGMLLLIIIMLVLFFVAAGITIEMVQEASAGAKADLARAWEESRGKMEPLIFSSIIAGVITALGYVLLIIPGLILSFAFYFVAQAVMIDGRSGTEALKRSYTFVKENLSDSIVLILLSLAIGLLLPMIPVIGALLSLLALPYIYAVSTLFYLDRRAMPSLKPETKVDVS